MNRKSVTPRSFLRQLAEPIPRTAAPLIPRRPAAERGAATRSGLDAIPQILDVTERKDTVAAEPQATQPANSAAGRLRPRRTKHERTIRNLPSQPNNQRICGGRSAREVSLPRMHPDAILQSTRREHTTTQSKTPSASTQEIAHLQPVLAHSVSAQATSPLSPTPSQTTGKSERRPDISVHIGTIEVRVPAPPARGPQPAPAALSPRNTQHAAPSRAAEPLSRSLAWNHGLVQG